MTTSTKTLTILGLAALAAGLFGTVRPASAAGLTHAAAFTRTVVIADHDDWNNRDNRRDFEREQQIRRDQILRRQEQFQREQQTRREEERRREEFRRHDDRRDNNYNSFGSNRDWHSDNNRDFRDNR